jgi:hypothetical protein
MTPLIPDNSISDTDWKRRVRDAVNSISKLLTQRGVTTARPAAPVVGQQFYDQTLSKPIWWSGSAWKDASGATV